MEGDLPFPPGNHSAYIQENLLRSSHRFPCTVIAGNQLIIRWYICSKIAWMQERRRTDSYMYLQCACFLSIRIRFAFVVPLDNGIIHQNDLFAFDRRINNISFKCTLDSRSFCVGLINASVAVLIKSKAKRYTHSSGSLSAAYDIPAHR